MVMAVKVRQGSKLRVLVEPSEGRVTYVVKPDECGDSDNVYYNGMLV